VRDRAELTRVLVELLPENRRITAEQARLTWWYDIRPNGGCRLTNEGYASLVKDLDIERYEVEITDPNKLSQRLVLQLNQRLKMPYYIHFEKRIPRSIMFFGSQEAMLAKLYGDIARFLEFYR